MTAGAGPLNLTLRRVAVALTVIDDPRPSRDVVVVKARRMRVHEPWEPRSVG